MQNAIKKLGWKAKDKVTGFTGIITHVGIDISGCLQAIVKPAVIKDKDTGLQKEADGVWYDVARLELLGHGPVFTPIPQKGTDLTAGSDNRKPIK